MTKGPTCTCAHVGDQADGQPWRDDGGRVRRDIRSRDNILGLFIRAEVGLLGCVLSIASGADNIGPSRRVFGERVREPTGVLRLTAC